MAKKLVISYSDVDREAAFKIREQLAAAGHDVWIASEDIKGAVDWTQSITDAIDASEGLILVWSEDARKSEDVHEEIRLARVFRKPVFPVLAHPESRAPGLPEEIDTLQLIGSGNLDENIVKLKARLADPRKRNIHYAELVRNAFIPRAHNPYFVGRERELKDLFVDSRGYRAKSKEGIPIAISGLPGIGKTDLALTFGYRFNLFFPDGVYWADAQNGIVQEFGKIGPQMHLEPHQEEHPREYAGRVREKLCQLSKGLIIFDNVTDFTEFREWYPQGAQSCSVILTSRMPPRAVKVKTMNLTELDPDSAYEMLLARRRNAEEIRANPVQRDALTEICRIIGNHPLALELCASSLQGFLMPSDYLQFIRPDPLERLGDENMNDAPPAAGTALLWKIFRNSYASLDETLVDPYFLLMCCFAPQLIDQKLIVQAYGKPSEGVRALDQLVKASFIRSEKTNTLSLHPLVAQFGRSLLKDKEFDYPGKFVEVMLGFLRAHQDSLTSEEVRREKLHIAEALRVAQGRGLWEACVDLYEYDADVEAGLPEQIQALDNAYQAIEKYLPEQKRRLPGLQLRLGKVNREAGRVREALDDFSRAEVLYGGIEDVDPAEAASLHFELGDAYLALGRYAEAGKTLSDALAQAVPHLDDSAPEVLQLRQALARHAFYLGDYDKAGAGLNKVLEDRKKFHAAHPDAASAAGLASVHADLSRLELARAHYPEALQAANAALAITKDSKENESDFSQLYLLLGNIQFEFGAYDQAEQQLQKACQVFLDKFGNQHPNYGRALKALGEVHRKQGKFKEAEKEVKQAVEIFRSIYGNSHPSVAEALAVQAKIYDHLCEFEKEQAVWEQVLLIQHEAYPEQAGSAQHPALAAAHYDYASLFMRKGEYARAAEHLQESLAITEKSLGKNHAEYFGRLVRLATCLYEQQEYARAQETLDEAKGLQEAIFKDSAHPYIARLLQLQSEILRRRGSFGEALRVIDQAIGMKKEIYGIEEHPSVAEALEVKVKIFHHLGKKSEAKLLIDRTLEIRRKAYGMNHPDLSRSLHDLGSYYLRLGQYKEAIEQFEEARRITETVFGNKHPDYVERTLNLANARNEQGEYRQALKLVESIGEVEPAWNRVLAARRLQLMGELQRRMGQFDEALKYINQAIGMKKEIYGTEEHPSVAEALAVQAKIYDHQCEFEKEQAVWEKVLEIQGRFYSKEHPALAASHYDYASLFMRKGEYARAAEHLQESLAITEKSLGKNHAEYFGRLVRLATCLYEQQKYPQVLDALEKAEGLQEAIFKDSAHPYIARLLQLKSQVLQHLARFDDALANIDQAIAMKKEIYGTEEHPSVAEALEVKVDLWLSQYHLKEVAQTLDIIERIRAKAYGVSHPQYANYQMRRAEWFEKRGRYEEAGNILKESLQTCLHVFSTDHPETIRRQIMLARMARMVNDLDGAEGWINRAGKSLGTRLETEDSQVVAEMYQERSHIHRAQGVYQDALAELEKALRIETRIFGSESPAVIELQNEKARLLILFHRLAEAEPIINGALQYARPEQSIFKRLRSDLLGQRGILQDHKQEYAPAIESLEEAIKIKRDLFGDDHVELARLYIEKAVVLRHLGKHTEALACLDQAQNIDNLYFEAADHIYYARILMEQGQTCLEKRNDSAAQEYLKEALQIYAARPNLNVKQHADAAEALGRSYMDTGFYHEASEMFQKAMEIRTAIYGSSHTEITETLCRQAQVLLQIARTTENPEAKESVRQKLEQARSILTQCDDGHAGLVSEIERTLANL